MTEDERHRWLHGIQAAEAEELDSLEANIDPQRDRVIADAVAKQLWMKKPRQVVFRARRVFYYVAALAAGIGIVMAARLFTQPSAPLVAMHIHLHGDTSVLGTGTAQPAVVRLASDSTLHIDIQPDQDISEALEVHAYLYQRDQQLLTPLVVNLQRSAQGRLQGKKRVAEFPPVAGGSLETVFVVARPAELPSDAEVTRILATGTASDNRAFQLLTEKIELHR